MRPFIIALLAAAFVYPLPAHAQQAVTVVPYMATLETDPKSLEIGKPATLELFVMDSVTMAPSEHLDVKATVSMPSMAAMIMDTPKVATGKKPGRYLISLTFPHAGNYRLTIEVRGKGGKSTKLAMTILPGSASKADAAMEGMSGMQMKAALGDWTASREGSGTSWQPDSSPMFMKMLPSVGGFDLSAMGTVQFGYVNDGGKRGEKEFFSDSMIMLMGQKEEAGGTLGLDFMTSLDPIINGEDGVPDLFQTGETAHGVPLVDRQHPHNLFSELAASYSHPLGKDWSAFVYGGPVGEPALGNVMFMHRPSGLEIPEAPITHHWFDSTHISFGVATLGVTYQDRWKLDGSVFNGHEPGENRYTIGPEGLNSASGRLSYNPDRDWSLSASYGYLDSPEAIAPGVNEHRLTMSVAYSHNFSNGDNVSATAYLGQDIVEGNSTPSNGWLGEATYYHARDAIFTRFENVDKDDLYNVPPGNYAINKLVFGDVHNFYTRDQIEYGLGAYLGFYSFPGSLDTLYGSNPVTFGIFLRIRPSKM
jgi:hypothetical protein